jgi:hypothetical protein
MSTKKATGKETLALTTTTEVPEVIKALQAQIDELKDIETSQWKTSGNLDGFGSIKEEKKIENLIRAYSSVKGRANAYEDAADDLGITTYPQFNINGGTVEDWKHDIQLRIAIVNHKEKLDKLKDFKAKAERFLSEEDQKKMLFNEMSAFLGLGK